jgi:dihydrofolate reductase
MKMIAAIDARRGIGYRNQLLFRLPPDLQRFKEMTLGHTVVMGRKTFESIGRPLPGRENIVLTRDRQFSPPGVRTIHQPEELWSQTAPMSSASPVFIIGGAQVYEWFLPFAEQLLLTRVEHTFAADCFFPAWPEADWELRAQQTGLTCATAEHGLLTYGYYEYARKKLPGGSE